MGLQDINFLGLYLALRLQDPSPRDCVSHSIDITAEGRFSTPGLGLEVAHERC